MLGAHCVMVWALVPSAGRAVENDDKQLRETPFFTQHSLCKIMFCLCCKYLGKVSVEHMSRIFLEFM